MRPLNHRIAIWITVASLSGIAGHSAATAQEPLATVEVQSEKPGRRIPRDFVGISLEVSTAGQGIGAFAPGGKGPARVAEYALGTPDAPNQVFFRFLRNLGPGILRLGGNSQDNTCWNAAAALHRDWCKGELTSGDLRLFSKAAAASGWRLIVGLNLKQNSPEWALSEVKQGIAKQIKPGEIIGLEIGNEPDLFSRDGSRPAAYSAADQVKEFAAYRDAFQKDPAARQYAVIGPATCCKWHNARDLGTFIDGVGASSLKLATVHSYLLTTCGGKKVSIEELLAPELMKRLDEQAKELVDAASERQVPLALAETNSASCGGMPGVSNAFAAALWGLDSLFSGAEDGYSGVDFHISYRSDGSSYNAVDTYKTANGKAGSYENVAEPLYYAMYFFARSASGRSLLPVEIKTAANVRAYATSECGTCAVNVTVLNKDAKASGRVRIHVSGKRGAASLLLMKAPKLESMASEVSYGGERFDGAGDIRPPHKQNVQPNARGEYEFELPTAAAAVLTVPADKRASRQAALDPGVLQRREAKRRLAAPPRASLPRDCAAGF